MDRTGIEGIEPGCKESEQECPENQPAMVPFPVIEYFNIFIH
jgi:hypothetical protein